MGNGLSWSGSGRRWRVIVEEATAATTRRRLPLSSSDSFSCLTESASHAAAASDGEALTVEAHDTMLSASEDSSADASSEPSESSAADFSSSNSMSHAE